MKTSGTEWNSRRKWASTGIILLPDGTRYNEATHRIRGPFVKNIWKHLENRQSFYRDVSLNLTTPEKISPFTNKIPTRLFWRYTEEHIRRQHPLWKAKITQAVIKTPFRPHQNILHENIRKCRATKTKQKPTRRYYRTKAYFSKILGNISAIYSKNSILGGFDENPRLV